jgi:hypothetical protein
MPAVVEIDATYFVPLSLNLAESLRSGSEFRRGNVTTFIKGLLSA